MARSISLPAPIDRTKLGPAMQKLTAQQQDFVFAFWETGNQTEAARRAGYSITSRHVTKAQGSRLMHNPQVRAAIQEFAGNVLTLDGTRQAVLKLVELLGSEDEKIALSAAKTILDRTGIVAATTHNVNVEVTLTQREKVAKLAELATQAGLDPAQVLGNVVDAEFEDIEEPEE